MNVSMLGLNYFGGINLVISFFFVCFSPNII